MRRALAAVMITAAALAGCEKKVGDDTFASITTGMEIVEVQRILGSHGEKQTVGGAQRIAGSFVGGVPGVQKAVETDREVYIWREDNREISVVFDKGKVVEKNKSGF